ncbi:MAG: carboxypeptidase regulatory-like domain-containing protein [Deltaproteobacteria bacterium]|nr:carboxypeptidase regulatory-like domain-containing protein [Deltaproteobacteria bacterium]
MRRSFAGIAALVVGIAIAVVAYSRCGGDATAPGASAPGTSAAVAAPGDRAAGARPADRGASADPRTLPRGRVSGTVRAHGAGPIAGAQVCATWYARGLGAEETREPLCAITDASGRYALTDLVPGSYQLYGSAAHYKPEAWHDAQHESSLRVHAGQVIDGIDLELDDGGVEVKGKVADINGGPVAGALVTASQGEGWRVGPGGAMVRSADDGSFTLWARPGTVTISASAEGYSSGSKTVTAPGALALVLLTPEAVLAGIVVEADTRRPVAGALVSAGSDWRDGEGQRSSALTDATGHFRLTRLPPGRYKPSATANEGYGEPAESVLLALGQTVEGIEIPLHPTATIRGKVVLDGADARPCPRGWVSILDAARDQRSGAEIDDDGTVTIRSVLPGDYKVDVWCTDHLSRDHYDPITVARADVDGLVWTVGDGGTVVGRIHTAAGDPVQGNVNAAKRGGDPRGQRSWGWGETERDGTFALHGLVPGSYDLNVSPDDAPAPRAPTPVEVKPGAVATVDIVIDQGGTITGTVVDERGAPVTGASVRAVGTRWSWDGGAMTADDGTFTIRGADPGEVRVTAARGWDAMRAPGSTDDDTQGKRITVVAGKSVSVRLVVESQGGSISGTVADATGQPIADAYVTAARESDAAGAASGDGVRGAHWTWDRKPIVTATDGSFTVDQLAPGRYTLRAYRRGGGEAFSEHVPVGTRARLVMKPAGAIAGTVVAPGGAHVDRFAVALIDRTTGFARHEEFYETGGTFALRELPAGTFTLEVTAPGARASLQLALTEGEHKDGVALSLERMVTVRGHLVELGATTPVAEMLVSISAVSGDESFTFDPNSDPERKNISDATGAFEVPRAPVGRAMVTAMPLDWEHSPYGFVRKVVVVAAGTDVVDVGAIELARRRVSARDRGGDLGFAFVEAPPETEPDQVVLKVSHIDAGGPASASGLAVGDVVVAVDGIDVRGDRNYLAGTLLEVPTGTTLKLGLARGATVAIVAGKPQ